MLLDYMLHIKHTKHFYLDSRGWNQGRYRGGGDWTLASPPLRSKFRNDGPGWNE